MNKIRILLLGQEEPGKVSALPDYLDIEYLLPAREEAAQKSMQEAVPYDLVILTRIPSLEEINYLYRVTKPYCLYLLEEEKLQGELQDFYTSKCGKRLRKEDLEDFLKEEARFFFSGSYGEKFPLQNISVSRDFTGSVKLIGKSHLLLQGEFGEDFRQIATFRWNIPIFKHQVLDFWLEYEKEGSVEIQLEIYKYIPGSLCAVEEKKTFSEKELENMVSFDGGETDGTIGISFRAKGEGALQLFGFHDRHSRGKHGFFLPGGVRKVNERREELGYYFEPGDGTPPLTVFFSGFKTKEGFEGLRLMRRMGTPFLLIADERVEGGCFYLGSDEYEQQIVEVIKNCMEKLEFTPSDLVLSGISMGSTAALYYGSMLGPGVILAGKPLTSLGEITENLRFVRPDEFTTAMDMLLRLTGACTSETAALANEKFWKCFQKADFSKTELAIAYMIEDDYENTAYEKIVSAISVLGGRVYGKGIHGRHNDDTAGIVGWFTMQLERILEENFGRKKEK